MFESSDTSALLDDTLPMEQLESQICELAGHLAAATCRFLQLLADFDAREGWASWDMPSCAAWLSWKCGMASGTAREQVRVARALATLPVIRAEFAAGRLSYSKARALTRIATADSDADLAEIAAPMTANQLERFARAHRTVTRADDEQALLARRLSWRLEDDGSLTLTARLPPEDGAVVLTALRAVLEHHDAPEGDEEPAAGASGSPYLIQPGRRPGRDRRVVHLRQGRHRRQRRRLPGHRARGRRCPGRRSGGPLPRR
jgi:hypothetical protein